MYLAYRNKLILLFTNYMIKKLKGWFWPATIVCLFNQRKQDYWLKMRSC